MIKWHRLSVMRIKWRPLSETLKNESNFFLFANYKQFYNFFISELGRKFKARPEAQICIATALISTTTHGKKKSEKN